MNDNNQALRSIVDALNDKKAKDLRVIDIHDLTTIASGFVIVSGTSTTHTRTLVDYVEEKLSEKGIKPLHIEGYNSARWVLLDYGDVVVHVFHEKDRDYYGLERLWQDGIIVDVGV